MGFISEGKVEAAKIAILGGGEDELNIRSEYHRDPGFDILGIYDRDPRAVAMEVAEIIGHGRSRKIVVFKKKRRKNYRRKNGHRQAFTEIKITGING